MRQIKAYIFSRDDFLRNVCFRTVLFLFAGILCSIVLPFSASAFDVIVVKSAELKPYREVARGLRKSCDCELQEMNAADIDAHAVAEKSPGAVVAIGTGALRKVRSITNLPIVYTMVIPSEVPPPSKQSNLSGVSMDISPETYLAEIKDIFPHAARIGLLYDRKNTAAFVAEARKAAAGKGLELVAREVRSPSMAAEQLGKMRGKIDVFWMLPDPTVVTPQTVDYLLQFSFQYNVPVFSFAKKYVEMGAVAALEIDPYDMGLQAGELVIRLLKKSTQAVRVYARTSHLAVNVKVARKMGIKISSEILEKANSDE